MSSKVPEAYNSTPITTALLLVGEASSGVSRIISTPGSFPLLISFNSFSSSLTDTFIYENNVSVEAV